MLLEAALTVAASLQKVGERALPCDIPGVVRNRWIGLESAGIGLQDLTVAMPLVLINVLTDRRHVEGDRLVITPRALIPARERGARGGL